MPHGETRDFIPIKFDFNTHAAENRFYIYSIRNRLKDKIYIGISRHPQRRINEQLLSKTELCDDYALHAKSDLEKPEHDRVFEFALVNPSGYPSALLGCTAEVLNILQLEHQKIAVYNKNKFGGHPNLYEARLAFEAIVIICDPAIQTHPSEAQMLCLEKHMSEITNYVKETENKDIINEDFIQTLHNAWDHFIDSRRTNGFGRSVISLEKVNLINYQPLRRITDSMPDEDEDELMHSP